MGEAPLEEPHPLAQPGPVLAAGVTTGIGVLAGLTAPFSAGVFLLTWVAGAAMAARRAPRADRPAPWRLHPRWRRKVRTALRSQALHQRALTGTIGREAERELVHQLVVHAWAIARWADRALRVMERGVVDGPDRVELRERIVDADRRLDEVIDGIRSAAGAATTDTLDRDAPDALDHGLPELRMLTDMVVSYRAALDEVDGLTHG